MVTEYDFRTLGATQSEIAEKLAALTDEFEEQLSPQVGAVFGPVEHQLFG